MVKQKYLDNYLNALLTGDRNQCRMVIEETLQSSVPAYQVYMDIIWPMMLEIDNLYRDDKINSAQEAFASRINRTIVNQLQNKLPRRPQKNKRVVIVTAQSDGAELGGQMINDLFESDGWDSRFLGGSVSNDDILAFIHGYIPDVLLLHGFNGKEAPAIRVLIDTVRDINAFPNMRIMLSGGVFARAEGLWEEIGADMYAENAADAVMVAQMPEERIKTPTRVIKSRSRTTNKSEEVLFA